MNTVRIKYTGKSYTCGEASNIELDILGQFLTSDVGCIGSSFKQWALDPFDTSTSSNATELEKKDGWILLQDMYSQEKKPTILKMTTEQFIQIFDDWHEKVCRARPQEVIITYQDGEFTIEALPHGPM